MELITVELLKSHLRILHDDEDAEIETKVEAANAYVSGFIDTTGEDYVPPADVVEAALLVAGHWWQCRENSAEGSVFDIPLNAQDIIASYREWSF